jgi:hypothetical protein
MTRGQAISWSVVAWLALGVCWFFATRNFHPTWALAVITTTSLVVAYAWAAYANHLVLIPAYLRRGRWGAYVASLLATMVVLTALALTVIRISYFRMWGPDADPNGTYKHFGIDFFGMGVHLLAAAAVVWLVQKVLRRG